jgi:hypothetical protein
MAGIPAAALGCFLSLIRSALERRLSGGERIEVRHARERRLAGALGRLPLAVTLGLVVIARLDVAFLLWRGLTRFAGHREQSRRDTREMAAVPCRRE